jgi:hypothetical protein
MRAAPTQRALDPFRIQAGCVYEESGHIDPRTQIRREAMRKRDATMQYWAGLVAITWADRPVRIQAQAQHMVTAFCALQQMLSAEHPLQSEINTFLTRLAEGPKRVSDPREEWE